jgi:hypothetical protein
MKNREIKFRALKDDVSNCRFYYGSLIYDKQGNTRIHDVDTKKLHDCINGTEGQFTGLQDKNYVDIYEGDIVEHNEIMYNNSIKKSDVIIFEEGCFILKKSTPLYIVCGGDFKAEVIGNIHQ